MNKIRDELAESRAEIARFRGNRILCTMQQISGETVGSFRLRQFSADDKLDFRIIVVKAIKDIKTRSGCQFIFDTNTSKQFTRHRQIVSLSLQ